MAAAERASIPPLKTPRERADAAGPLTPHPPRRHRAGRRRQTAQPRPRSGLETRRFRLGKPKKYARLLIQRLQVDAPHWCGPSRAAATSSQSPEASRWMPLLDFFGPYRSKPWKKTGVKYSLETAHPPDLSSLHCPGLSATPFSRPFYRPSSLFPIPIRICVFPFLSYLYTY
jgi:hypothetical protein